MPHSGPLAPIAARQHPRRSAVAGRPRLGTETMIAPIWRAAQRAEEHAPAMEVVAAHARRNRSARGDDWLSALDAGRALDHAEEVEQAQRKHQNPGPTTPSMPRCASIRRSPLDRGHRRVPARLSARLPVDTSRGPGNLGRGAGGRRISTTVRAHALAGGLALECGPEGAGA